MESITRKMITPLLFQPGASSISLLRSSRDFHWPSPYADCGVSRTLAPPGLTEFLALLNESLILDMAPEAVCPCFETFRFSPSIRRPSPRAPSRLSASGTAASLKLSLSTEARARASRMSRGMSIWNVLLFGFRAACSLVWFTSSRSI